VSRYDRNTASACFRSKPESSKIIPEKLYEPRAVKVHFGAVEFEIEDRASYKAVIFDFERLVDENPEGDWARIRSIAAFVEGTLNPEPGKRAFRLESTYYDLDAADENGRVQSHPGYRKPNWTLPNLELEEPNMHDEPWEKVIKREVPLGATKYRETQIPVGTDADGKILYKIIEVFFEIEDPHWYPPDDWKSDMDSCDLWPQEVGEYRRWLRVDEAGSIPRVEVRRFRPYKGDGPV
jgi:hypothetical protein